MNIERPKPHSPYSKKDEFIDGAVILGMPVVASIAGALVSKFTFNKLFKRESKIPTVAGAALGLCSVLAYYAVAAADAQDEWLKRS